MKLHQHVTDYIAFKKVLGGRFQTEARILKAFSKTMGNVDITQIEPTSVQAFIAGKGAVTSFWHQKFGVLTRFYRFLMIRNHIDSTPCPKLCLSVQSL